MSKYILLTKAFFLTLLLCSCNNFKKPQKEIIQVWQKYNKAVAQKDGTFASELIDSSTIKYYDSVLVLVKNTDSVALSKLRVDKKLLILLIRHTISRQKIKTFDGKSLFSYCIQSGYLGNSDNNILRHIQIKKNTAKAELFDIIKNVSLIMRFNKENNVWKINFSSFYNSKGEFLYKWMIKESGQTETAFLYSVLKLANNKTPENSIWHSLN